MKCLFGNERHCSKPAVLQVSARGLDNPVRVCVDCVHDLTDALRSDRAYSEIRITAPESKEYPPHRA